MGQRSFAASRWSLDLDTFTGLHGYGLEPHFGTAAGRFFKVSGSYAIDLQHGYGIKKPQLQNEAVVIGWGWIN